MGKCVRSGIPTASVSLTASALPAGSVQHTRADHLHHRHLSASWHGGPGRRSYCCCPLLPCLLRMGCLGSCICCPTQLLAAPSSPLPSVSPVHSGAFCGVEHRAARPQRHCRPHSGHCPALRPRPVCLPHLQWRAAVQRHALRHAGDPAAGAAWAAGCLCGFKCCAPAPKHQQRSSSTATERRVTAAAAAPAAAAAGASSTHELRPAACPEPAAVLHGG